MKKPTKKVVKKVIKKTTAKIQKKPTAYKVTRKKEPKHTKILSAEGYRRAMLKKLKKS